MKTILLLGAKSPTAPLESVPAELSRIKQALTRSPTTDLHIEYEPYLTQELLGDLLRQHADQVDILHFAGHSNAVQLTTNDAAIYSHHIADLLRSWHSKPRLVFLNGCHNAAQVQNLLDAGVRCVIATHRAIDDQEAARFAREFYAHLLERPDRVTVKLAFERAGSVVLMGEPRKARSLDVDTLERADGGEDWDWGYLAVRRAAAETVLQPPPVLSHFIRQKKQESAQQRWELLYERLTRLLAQYDLETRSEEKMRMEAIIRQNRDDLAQVEQELDELQAGEKIRASTALSPRVV
ncbi:MAG: CHAT domain-containing protein [Thiolinea sp.]